MWLQQRLTIKKNHKAEGNSLWIISYTVPFLKIKWRKGTLPTEDKATTHKQQYTKWINRHNDLTLQTEKYSSPNNIFQNKNHSTYLMDSIPINNFPTSSIKTQYMLIEKHYSIANLTIPICIILIMFMMIRTIIKTLIDGQFLKSNKFTTHTWTSQEMDYKLNLERKYIS